MERREITVRGIVQGVGFRPFVHQLASSLDLCGSVRNHSGAVVIEVEGESPALDAFLNCLHAPPKLARIHDIQWRLRDVRRDADFRIETSQADASSPVFLSPDVATCDACLAELLDPADRRFRYPFLNCTHCGPRLTIIRGAPYDRPRTTMAGFELCPDCRAEYEDPENRRFHAQPTACPACGPQLQLVAADGRALKSDDALETFADRIRNGAIGALQGLGGFHLVCDATNADAVQTLRHRKQRDDKPFAVMMTNVPGAEAYCHVSPAERSLLQSPARPIVLLRKRDTQPAARISDQVAPGNPNLGVMLPYTPLHHLLLETLDCPLVMTSGNVADEPIVIDLAAALERLGTIADLFLANNRPIQVRCDDSVTRIVSGQEAPIRRSRGYAPQPVRLPMRCELPQLCVGGQLKSVFALARDDQAILSHHVGDLDHLANFQSFQREIRLYEELFQMTPSRIVHDLHPEYLSNRYAVERAAAEGIPRLAVQHHHAHLASGMAEHGLTGPAIGVIFDGSGYGIDACSGQATIWGGEFLVGDYRVFRRAAHFRNVRLPGGDRAIREPWRMAVAHLRDADCNLSSLAARWGSSAVGTVEQMLERGLNSPLTSSVGRLFDAVSALVGLRDEVTFEGQAAMELEWQATTVDQREPYPFVVAAAPDAVAPHVVDTRPLIAAVQQDAAQGASPAVIGRRFHATLVEIIVDVCERIRAATGLDQVVFSGGVFLNALLASSATDRLEREHFRVYRQHLVPPGDGGLSLGQCAVAAATPQEISEQERT